jgi:hypothetical protein
MKSNRRKLRLTRLVPVLALALLTGCGDGRPKPVEADVKSVIDTALAGRPLSIAEVDFDRRDITGETAALTFNLTFRHAFDLYKRDSLSDALAARGKDENLLSAGETWSKLRLLPIYERLRTAAGVSADATPVDLPGRYLVQVAKAGDTQQTRAQARAKWDGFKWIITDLQMEKEPESPGKKRGEFADDLAVIARPSDLDPLIARVEDQAATVKKLLSAGESVVAEKLQTFAATVQPGAFFGGTAGLIQGNGQRLTEAWLLEIVTVDAARRSFTALLRGEAPGDLARKFTGEWSYTLTDSDLKVTLQSPAAEAVKNAGPALGRERDQSLTLVVRDTGWNVETESVVVTFAPLDASAAAAHQARAVAEAEALAALLAPGASWNVVQRERNETNEYVLTITEFDPALHFFRATLAAPGAAAGHPRPFTGALELNRYEHEGWPLRLDSPFTEALVSKRLPREVTRNVGGLVQAGTPSLFLRVVDGRLEIKPRNASYTLVATPLVGGRSAAIASFTAAPEPSIAPTGASSSLTVPAGWDGLTPALLVADEPREASLAAIKINQSMRQIVTGDATITLTETRPLPVLPASGWHVLMGGAATLKTGIDAPTLSLVTRGKLELKKSTDGGAAVPASERIALQIIPVNGGAWFAPRAALAPGTYALLVDTACFAFEVR